MVGEVSVFIPFDSCSSERTFTRDWDEPIERIVPEDLSKVIIGTDIILIVVYVCKIGFFVGNSLFLPIHNHLFNRSQISEYVPIVSDCKDTQGDLQEAIFHEEEQL